MIPTLDEDLGEDYRYQVLVAGGIDADMSRWHYIVRRIIDDNREHWITSEQDRQPYWHILYWKEPMQTWIDRRICNALKTHHNRARKRISSIANEGVDSYLDRQRELGMPHGHRMSSSSLVDHIGRSSDVLVLADLGDLQELEQKPKSAW